MLLLVVLVTRLLRFMDGDCMARLRTGLYICNLKKSRSGLFEKTFQKELGGYVRQHLYFCTIEKANH
jgi:hypothetical protein